MSREVAEILREALELEPAARAELAGSLLDSLDAQADEDEDVQKAWQAEIQRRGAAVDAGDMPTYPWLEARRMITGG